MIWSWPSYCEFVAHNLAVPVGVSLCLWLLLGKHNRKCTGEAKRGLALSIGLLLLVVSIIQLNVSFTDDGPSGMAFRLLFSAGGFAITVFLGLVANRYSESESIGGWLLVAIGMALLTWMLYAAFKLTGPPTLR
jgi:hypothetical protein